MKIDIRFALDNVRFLLIIAVIAGLAIGVIDYALGPVSAGYAHIDLHHFIK